MRMYLLDQYAEMKKSEIEDTWESFQCKLFKQCADYLGRIEAHLDSRISNLLADYQKL